MPSAHSLATLATLGKVPPVLDRIERAFVKQSVKPWLHYSTECIANRALLDSSPIVRIPLSPPLQNLNLIQKISDMGQVDLPVFTYMELVLV